MTTHTNEATATSITAEERDILKSKLIIAAAISVPNIIVMNPTLVPSLSDRFPAGTYGEGLAWSIMALISVPVFLWAGSHMLLSMKRMDMSLEALFGLGLTGAFFYSLAIAIMPGFDTLVPNATPLWDYIDVVVTLALIVKLMMNPAEPSSAE